MMWCGMSRTKENHDLTASRAKHPEQEGRAMEDTPQFPSWF